MLSQRADLDLPDSSRKTVHDLLALLGPYCTVSLLVGVFLLVEVSLLIRVLYPIQSKLECRVEINVLSLVL